MKIIIYLSNFQKIGGVERFVLNFCKRFPETLVLYDTGSPEIGEKLIKNKRYNCDVFISASAWGYRAFDNVEAKVYAQMIHADYRHVIDNWSFKYTKHPKTTHHICVSQTVKEGFEAVTPYKCDAVFYNFVDDSIKPIPKTKNDVLKLVTISRISKEKGFERMIEFAKLIPVPYVWEVWGEIRDTYGRKLTDQMDFKGITKTPHLEIAKADYLVQLSDSEGNSCIVNEALQMQTPVLITPFPSGFEQVENGKNGYFVPFDLDNIDFDSIINNIPKVKPYKDKTTAKDWIDLFKFAIQKYNDNMVKIKIIAKTSNFKIGEIVEVSKERATSAIDRGLAEVYFDDIVVNEPEEVKPSKSKKKASK